MLVIWQQPDVDDDEEFTVNAELLSFAPGEDSVTSAVVVSSSHRWGIRVAIVEHLGERAVTSAKLFRASGRSEHYFRECVGEVLRCGDDDGASTAPGRLHERS